MPALETKLIFQLPISISMIIGGRVNDVPTKTEIWRVI